MITKNKGLNINSQDEKGRTALHLAIEKNHVESVYILLDEGACANVRDIWGNTPLTIAAKKGHSLCIRALLFHSILMY